MKVFALLILTLSSAIASAAPQEIKASCTSARNLQLVHTLSGVREQVCRLESQFQNNTQIRSAANQVTRIIHRLEGTQAGKDWERDPTLSHALERLNTTLTNEEAAGSESDIKKLLSSLSLQKLKFRLSLREFLDRWNDPTVRTLPRNQEAYIRDMNQLLSQTQTGAAIQKCFIASKSPQIQKESVVPIQSLHLPDNRQGGMRFELVEDPKDPGHFIKTIYFDATKDPLQAFLLFAHETKHGCRANEDLRLKNSADAPWGLAQKAKEAGNQAEYEKHLKTYEKTQSAYNQQAAVDEIRAYAAQAQLFQEVADAAPDFFCNRAFTGKMFGKYSQTLGEYHLKMQEMIRNGTFPRFVLQRYSEIGSQYAPWLFVTDENGLLKKPKDGNHILRPELIRQIEQAGFRVKA